MRGSSRYTTVIKWDAGWLCARIPHGLKVQERSKAQNALRRIVVHDVQERSAQ